MLRTCKSYKTDKIIDISPLLNSPSPKVKPENLKIGLLPEPSMKAGEQGWYLMFKTRQGRCYNMAGNHAPGGKRGIFVDLSFENI